MTPKHGSDHKENLAKVKTLRKSKGPIFGVCGGIAIYSGIDPLIVRIVVVVLSFLTFPVPPLVYITLALILPSSNREHKRDFQNRYKDKIFTDSKLTICSRCNEKNNENRNFCKECGESLF
ncbi:MAG: PspC domain-containing protein [Calditrichia bacterium]